MRKLFGFIKNSQNQIGLRRFCEFINQSLRNVTTVVIGEGDILPYILVSVYEHGASGMNKTILRAMQAEEHLLIYYATSKEIAKMELCTQCMGGGRLRFDHPCKTVTIFDKCSTFGKADVEKTKTILRRHLKDYKIKSE